MINLFLPDGAGTTFSRILAFSAEFRIRDILVWIRMRIRILGSLPLNNGSGSVPKPSVTFRMQKYILSIIFNVLINEI
jgi:hypothetical protein